MMSPRGELTLQVQHPLTVAGVAGEVFGSHGVSLVVG